MSPSERASGSSGTAYSVKSAWRHPACVFSAFRAPERSSAAAVEEALARDSFTRRPAPNASRSNSSSHASSELGATSPFAPHRNGGVDGRPSQRVVNASGPGPKRTVALSPSAKSSFTTESTSRTVPS